jgi:quercetin dioxygenase-like cupin family protein
MDVKLAETPVHRVEAQRIQLAPGLAPGAHVHNGPVFGCILHGGVILQVDDGPETRLGPGDAFHEPAETRISRFDALEDGCTFLAYFPLGQGEQAELVMLDAG